MANDDVLIRSAVETDAAYFAHIYRDEVMTGTATFEISAPDADEMARRWRRLTELGYPWLSAECDGALLGFAYIAPFREREAFSATAENSIYIAPSARRRGVGKRLLTALLDDAGRCGLKEVIAVIGEPDVQMASVRLHIQCGFEMAGRIVRAGRKFDRWLDIVLMQKSL